MCQRDGGCCGRGSRPKGRRIPPTTPATQRRTGSLGNAAVCAPRSPSMKRSIAAKLIRDEPTTNRLGERDGDIAGMCAYLLSEDRVVAPCATVKHSRRRHSAAGRAARARPASARSRALSPRLGPGPTDVRRPLPALTPPGVVLVSRVRISIGVRMPRAGWRRPGCGRSRCTPKIALASSTRVVQRCVSSSSICIRDHNAFDQRVVVAVADGAHRWHQRGRASSR
jgi:hypothetical protein